MSPLVEFRFTGDAWGQGVLHVPQAGGGRRVMFAGDRFQEEDQYPEGTLAALIRDRRVIHDPSGTWINPNRGTLPPVGTPQSVVARQKADQELETAYRTDGLTVGKSAPVQGPESQK